MSATAAVRCSAMRLCNLLVAAGRQVTREYYINDAGAQVDVLARSAFQRYREAPGRESSPSRRASIRATTSSRSAPRSPQSHGRGLLDMPEAEWLPLVREAALGMMMDMIRADLAAIGIRHDVFFSERTLQAERRREMRYSQELRDRGLVYEGRLPPPKGQLPEDWEDREQTLFRTTGVRRRGRPAAAEIGRLLHVFRLRHRLSPGEVSRRRHRADRRPRRRPWRLCQAHAGGREGGERRAKRRSTSSYASWCGCCAQANP